MGQRDRYVSLPNPVHKQTVWFYFAISFLYLFRFGEGADMIFQFPNHWYVGKHAASICPSASAYQLELVYHILHQLKRARISSYPLKEYYHYEVIGISCLDDSIAWI